MAYVKVKRPGFITAICVIGFIWMVFVLPGMFSPGIKRLGDFAPMIYGLILAATFMSLIGIWHMKRWGAELYIFSFFCKQIFFLFTDQLSGSAYVGIFFSVLFIVVLMVYYRRMDRNL